MAKIVKQTVMTRGTNTAPVVNTQVRSVKSEATTVQTLQYLIYFMFGILEVLLGFRLILKLMGASLASSFVAFIYGLTGVFILPFEGIFHRAVSQGIETASVLEPSAVVALIVYALVAFGIVKLIQIFSGEEQES